LITAWQNGPNKRLKRLDYTYNLQAHIQENKIMKSLSGWLFLVSSFFLLPAAFPAYAQSTEISSIRVDVRELRRQGAGQGADLVAAALQDAAQQAFGPNMNRSGPQLVIRITSLNLNAWAGDSGDDGPGGTGNSDYLDGEALLIGADGRILSRLPQLSALPANSGGAWYVEGNERRRIIALSQHYAAWLQRRL
jgi:hypothetical protein